MLVGTLGAQERYPVGPGMLVLIPRTLGGVVEILTRSGVPTFGTFLKEAFGVGA